MKIAILGGGGAMGGLFGGPLAAAGNDVTLVDVAKPAIEAINSRGLSVETKDGSKRVYRTPATSDSASVGVVDLVVNFVKCYQTEAAVRAALPMIGADTAVLTLQNGWGNAARIGAIVGDGRVMVGLTYHSGTLLGPGEVRHPGTGMTYIGELNGRITPRLTRIVEAFRAAGFETTASERILDEIWKKLALNVCSLPTAALTCLTADGLAKHEPMLGLMRALLKETVAVAAAQDIRLDEEERWSFIVALLQQAVGARPSMLQDVEAKRRTEIEVINGAIVDAGRSCGVATPMNQAMVWLVQSMQAAYLG